MAASEVRKMRKRKQGFESIKTAAKAIKGDLLKLKDVIDLGGTKEDFEMLKNVTDSAKDISSTVEKIDANNLQNEVEGLVKSLGLENMVMESDDNKEDTSDDQNSSSEEEPSISEDHVPAVAKKHQKPSKEEKKNTEVSIPKFEKLKKILIKPDTFWHEQIPSISDVKEINNVDHQTAKKIQEIAKQFWENEVEAYQERKNNEKSSDANWLHTVLSSGTLSDRVAASTMLLQESPVHQMKRLDSLLSMAKKKGRREAIMAIDSLRNLWTTSLLPDRKLKHFWQWPMSQIKELCKESGKAGEPCLLILWYFEDLLKNKCAEFVDILENLSRDTIPGIRDKTAGTMYELLVAKPEQEQRLLTAIVNKLGDPTRKVASRASYLLGQLVIKHPNMKLTVIQEVERLLYRPNIAKKAQYYAICFLNQLILTKSENAVASKLISIYFSFFKAYASENSSETKMLSALLSGVNRAFPYTEDKEDKYEDQLNMLFKICHTGNFHTSVQALMLLFQVMESRKTVTDRYYRALYEKLFDIGINTTAKRTMFLNIIYKSMKNDPAINRIKAFFKRLLQVSSCEEPNFVCGLLYLLSEVLKLKPGIKGLVMQPEEDDDEEHFQDIDEDKFTAPNEDKIDKDKNEEKEEQSKTSQNLNQGWTFRDQELKRTGYDISCRNPLFCGAQFSSAWEVHPLLKHYHPSVNRFAESILHDNAIEYKGDPLQDFTLVRFLDRFMYKNPKKKAKDHGSSIMQPRKISERSMELPVNSKNFTEMKIEKVREDEIFFYRYFKRKAEIDEAKKGKKKKKLVDDLDAEDESDSDDFDADEFDFASEMHKSKESEPKKKKKKQKDDDDDDESDFDEGNDIGGDEEMSDQGDFDYDDLDFAEDEEFDEDFDNEMKPKGKQNFTDADYEKALLENLTDSDINDDDGDDDGQNDRPGNDRISSMFAAADEFAHLLEGSEVSKGQKSQARWEARNSDWKDKQGKKRKREFGSKGTHKERMKNSNKNHPGKNAPNLRRKVKNKRKFMSNRKRKN